MNPAWTDFSTDQMLTFTSAGISLEANTTYFLVVDFPLVSGTPQVVGALQFTSSGNEDNGGVTGWSIANNLIFRTRRLH